MQEETIKTIISRLSSPFNWSALIRPTNAIIAAKTWMKNVSLRTFVYRVKYLIEKNASITSLGLLWTGTRLECLNTIYTKVESPLWVKQKAPFGVVVNWLNFKGQFNISHK